MNKLYHLDITISNEHGELLDKRMSFTSLEEVNAFMTDSIKMHELWCEAEDNGKKDGILYEELYDSKEEYEEAKRGDDDMEIAIENGYDGGKTIN